MARRTNEPAVREIIDTELESQQVQRFMDDAALWIDEELDTTENAFTADRLEIIERWLSAALIRVRDLGLSNANMGDVREQYQVDATVTDYLLRAASFDPTGTIRKHFLAPKPVAAPEASTFTPVGRVGTGFIDST